MAGLILRKEEFFLPPHRQWRWQTATRKMSLPNIPMSSASWCWCGEATGCTSLTIVPGALPAAICSTFAPKINTPMLPLTIWFCRTSSIARSGCSSILTGPGRSWPLRYAVEAPLAHGQHRYGAGAPVISQLEHECARRDAQGNAMAELLFAQLALTLQRHRYATDDPRRRSAKRCWTNCWPRWRPASAAPLFWSVSASRRAAASGRFASSFASKPG